MTPEEKQRIEKSEDNLSVERHLVKVKQKEKEMLQIKLDQTLAALDDLIHIAEYAFKDCEIDVIKSAIERAKKLRDGSTK